MLLWVRSPADDRGELPITDAERIPDAGIALLVLTAMDAAALARRGKFAAGYHRLADGLRQVERLRPSGDPWIEKLVRLYQEALQGYCARCGVPLD